jgi:hypothetical protein
MRQTRLRTVFSLSKIRLEAVSGRTRQFPTCSGTSRVGGPTRRQPDRIAILISILYCQYYILNSVFLHVTYHGIMTRGGSRLLCVRYLQTTQSRTSREAASSGAATEQIVAVSSRRKLRRVEVKNLYTIFYIMIDVNFAKENHPAAWHFLSGLASGRFNQAFNSSLWRVDKSCSLQAVLASLKPNQKYTWAKFLVPTDPNRSAKASDNHSKDWLMLF